MSKIKTQKDLIINLKSTDEYKRSKAIAGCITFLSDKIKELELDKNNLLTKLDDLSKKNLSQKDLNIKLKSELEVQKSQNGLYKKKLTVLEELNKTFEQTVSELKNKIEKQKIEQKERNEQYEIMINKYKKIANEAKNEKEQIKNENKSYKKLIENNKKLISKIKKYEVLLYKMDFENQGYKDEIQKYQNQLATVTGQNFNFVPIYKIDLNSELETIEDKNKNDNIKEETKLTTENNNTEEYILTTNNENENNEDEKSAEDNNEEIEIETNTNENNIDNENNDDNENENSKEEYEENNLKENDNSEDNNEKDEDFVQTQDNIEDNHEE